MTLPYQDNPITHVVAIACPSCGKEANFEFAEYVKVSLRKDIPYFQNSKFFEHRKVSNSDGQGVNLAFYFHKLHAHGFPAIDDLPEGYAVSDWAHYDHLYRSYKYDAGTVYCIPCGLRRKHQLVWPSEAYFQIDYKGHVLWAFNRRSAAELKDFIQSKERGRSQYEYRSFLLKLPPQFLAKSARNTVVKRLSAKLAMRT
ncbi:MAG: hypothetical protein ABJN69_08155 [Hellea sp.]